MVLIEVTSYLTVSPQPFVTESVRQAIYTLKMADYNQFKGGDKLPLLRPDPKGSLRPNSFVEVNQAYTF